MTEGVVELKRTKNVTFSFIFLIIAIFPAAYASAALQAVGNVDLADGFPVWYQDSNNIAVEKCMELNSGMCLLAAADLPNPAAPISFPDNYPAEIFWWVADTSITNSQIDGLMVLAMEGSFAGEQAIDGEQSSFGRVRFRVDVPATGTYTITYPFGTASFDVAALIPGPEIKNEGTDIGCFAQPGVNSCDPNDPLGSADPRFNFAAALGSGIGPYLKWDPNVLPAAPAGYLGNPSIEHAVIGSPTGNNVFRIEGPSGVDLNPAVAGIQTVIETNLFTVSGKLYSGPVVVNMTSANADGNYKIGDAININATFSAPVVVTGTPLLTLETGAVDKTASYVSGSGTSTLTFAYTLQSGDISSDLNYSAISALALNGGTINDAVLTTTASILNLPSGGNSLGGNKNIAVDGVVPTGAVTSNANAAGQLKIGDTITFTLTPSSAEPGASVTGSYNGVALAWATADAGASYTATYTVADGNPDQAVPLQITGVVITDAAGNPSAAISGIGLAKTIDANAPAVISVSSSIADGNYGIGSSIPVLVAFSDAVNVTGTPLLTMETGITDRNAAYSSGSGTSTLTFTYTVQAGDSSPDLNVSATDSLSLNTGTITDYAGNNANIALPAASSLSINKNIAVDGAMPSVSGSAPAANSKVNNLNTVSITISDDTGADTANTAVSVSKGGLQLTEGIDFTRSNGANSRNSIINVTIAIPTDGSYSFNITPVDVNGNSGTASLVTIISDTVQPIVTNVAGTDGAFAAGHEINVTVTFNEATSVVGSPVLLLETGAIDREAAYASGTGTSALTFTYAVQSGDSSPDLDYTGADSLRGSITDEAGNAANLSLPLNMLALNSNIIVDTQRPAISAISAAPSHDSATIAWTTDENTNSSVMHGNTVEMLSNATSSAMTTSHSISLPGLSASTLYFFSVSSCDAAGNCNTSAQQNFTTNAAPQVSTGGGSGGGGGGSGGGSVQMSEASTSTSISYGEYGLFTFKKSRELGVYEVAVRANGEYPTPRFVVKEAKLAIGEPVPEGTVFKYLSLSTSVNTSEATISFKVPVTWYGNGTTADNTVLYRLKGRTWNRLQTTRINSDSEYHYFSAGTPGFSIFAIAVADKEVKPAQETQETKQLQAIQEPEQKPEEIKPEVQESNQKASPITGNAVAVEQKGESNLWMIALVAIAALVMVYITRR